MDFVTSFRKAMMDLDKGCVLPQLDLDVTGASDRRTVRSSAKRADMTQTISGRGHAPSQAPSGPRDSSSEAVAQLVPQ